MQDKGGCKTRDEGQAYNRRSYFYTHMKPHYIIGSLTYACTIMYIHEKKRWSIFLTSKTHRRVLALMDILGSALVPVLRISLVDGENVASLWDGHFRIGQNKLSHSLRIRKQHVTKYISKGSCDLLQGVM